MSTSVATILYPITPVATILIVWLLLNRTPKRQEETPTPLVTAQAIAPNSRLYRQPELQRALASLKANAPILITGEEGSGKTKIKDAIVHELTEEGFTVGTIELASTKQMLLNLCEQLGLDTYNIEGKHFTIDGLKVAIANFFQQKIAFLVVDDAHGLPSQFRMWLKALKRQGVPMLLLATDPPKSDVFLNVPRMELKPLPEYAIRELMEQAAMARGMQLDNHQLSSLQERAGGNPMLAERVIDEEYLGVDIETGDHRRYIDATPLLVLVGIGFVVIRFIGLGTGDQALYIFGGIAAAVFLGVSRLLYSLPKESRRIQS